MIELAKENNQRLREIVANNLDFENNNQVGFDYGFYYRTIHQRHEMKNLKIIPDNL
jgi:hypothetical protein